MASGEMVSMHRENDRQPKYMRLAAWVREQVQSGRLQPDQQLLSYAEIEEQLGFSQNTVERAYKILEEEGLIYRAPGRGVFVKPQEKPSNAQAPITGFIGYVDEHFQDSRNFLYYTHLMAGVRDVVDEAGKQLVIISSLRDFPHWNLLEGIVLCAAAHHPSYSSEPLHSFIPPELPIVNSLLPLDDVPTVLSDDGDGIRQLVKHLVELGHERIALFSDVHYGPLQNHPLVKVRYEAYQSALKKHRIVPQPEWVYSPRLQRYGDFYKYGFEGMQLWLQNGWRELNCTAIVAHNDLTAMGIIDALREAGLSVPGDVSVVGFDNAEIYRIAPYQLTTIKVPLDKIGARAVELLLERIENPQQKMKDVLLPVQLVEGQTSAAPRTLAVAS